MFKCFLIVVCILFFVGFLLVVMFVVKLYVLIVISFGEIEVEFDLVKVLISVKNFFEYVDSGYYDGILFYCVILGFMVQIGGFSVGMQEKKICVLIKNEVDNGLFNECGIFVMVCIGVVDLVISQFFINLIDNDFFNYGVCDFGYVVFGKVVCGMGVVDQIVKVFIICCNGFVDVLSDDVVILFVKCF